jgi:predicted dienelactone hydrolase
VAAEVDVALANSERQLLSRLHQAASPFVVAPDMTPLRRLSFRLASACALIAAGVFAPGVRAQTIPADVFPKPVGRYAIGTLDTVWVDDARGEALTRDPSDKRHVPVRIWYPADSTTAPRAPYILRAEEFGTPSPFEKVRHVVTHSVVGAPVARGDARFPVLLYNHGGGWSRFTATFEIEHLVSLGYVVVGVDHLGFNQSKSLSNGYVFKGDTLGFPEPTNTDPKGDALRSWEYLERRLFPMWVADAQFVLDRIEGLDRNARSPLSGRLDLARIGAFGWSFGGATAVDLLIRDPRVKAAIDQDGQLFGKGRTDGASRPVMLMHSTEDPTRGVPADQHVFVHELVAKVRGWDEQFRTASTDDVYDVEIARTAHGNFSDLTLFFPRDTSTLQPAYAHAIITAYTVAFFDRYLNGRESKLLDGASADFPEVTLVRKAKRGGR